ncbi:hypothetical protein Anas_11843, partial [Armadillidium nasatum]
MSTTSTKISLRVGCSGYLNFTFPSTALSASYFPILFFELKGYIGVSIFLLSDVN